MTGSTSLGRYLSSAEYVLALVGAGLSASSGIPTFQDMRSWGDFEPSSFATRSAFAADPVGVWQFYEGRRRNALYAEPNSGHVALAQIAASKNNFLAITQNIDELSQRAGHPALKLAALHGSLFTVRCTNERCMSTLRNTSSQPILSPAMLGSGTHGRTLVAPPIPPELSRCMACNSGLLRPGVVWFGERLDEEGLACADGWLDSVPRVDLMLVIGTSARVFPAAEYIGRARELGAHIAHFNVERNDELLEEGDWYVPGDAAVTLPRIAAEVLRDPTACET